MQVSCPQCGKMLESPVPLPERAQCPFCAAIFAPAPTLRSVAEPPPPPPMQSTSPFAPPATAYAATPPSSLRAADQLRTPAVGVMIAGILSLIYALMDLVLCIHYIVGFQQGQPLPNMPPFLQNLLQPNPTQLTIEAIFDGIKLIWCSVIIYGALKMMRLQSYGLALTSSILSLIFCMTCCFPLGVPFGIWSLVVLNRPEVRASFT